MKNYEIMFIVRPTLSEDDVKKVVKDFSDIITKSKTFQTSLLKMVVK